MPRAQDAFAPAVDRQPGTKSPAMTSAIDPMGKSTDPPGGPSLSPSPRQSTHRSAHPHVFIGELDIVDGLTSLSGSDADGRRWTEGRVLVRCFTEPIGLLYLDIPADGLSVPALSAAVEEQLGDRIRLTLHQAGVEIEGVVPADGVISATVPPYLEARNQALLAAPEITVAICTRDRPEKLRKALRSLENQEYPAMRVLVVDNAPADTESRQVASEQSSQLDLDYIVEPTPGLSWARNRALDHTTTEIIAWIDDDETADRWWVTELARAMVEHPEAGAVSGIILPGEIESSAQLWFEEGGGHHKGRGFEPQIFSPATRRSQSPLYPRPQFGTGGNMAFRRDAIEAIGRFNTALGAGTAAKGAEDTAAFSEYLYAGGTLVYHPSALVWHSHRSRMDDLRELRRGYGRGITAFYLSFLLRHPEAVFELARLFPKAIGDIAPDSDDPTDAQGGGGVADRRTMPNKPTEATPQFTRELYRGLLEGMPMYLLAAWRSHQLAKNRP